MRRIQRMEGLDTPPLPCEYFDVIAGTGAGALQACMFGKLGMTVDEAIDAYVKLMTDVFSDKKWFTVGGSEAFRSTKLREGVVNMVESRIGKGERMIGSQNGSNSCKVMVFAMSHHNLNASIPTIFRSYEAHENPAPECTVSEAICASMAYPDLFKRVEIGRAPFAQPFVGGGIGCNNPLVHVLNEVQMTYSGRHIGSIISLGAGHTSTIQIPRSSGLNRILPTDMIHAMKSIATDSERVAQGMALRFQGTSDIYFRFSVDQGLQTVKLSEWERLPEVAANTQAHTRLIEVNNRLKREATAVKERQAVLPSIRIGGQVLNGGAIEEKIVLKFCPIPTPYFTGFESQLRRLKTCLSAGEATHERRIGAIRGLGDVGKTQIALKVIEETREVWKEVIYIDASSKDTIMADLKAFAIVKRIGNSHRATLQWLTYLQEPWLLLFDNADSQSLRLRDFFPQCNHGSILITTRLRDAGALAQGPGSDCHISKMDSQDAMDLLLKRARVEPESLSDKQKVIATRLLEVIPQDASGAVASESDDYQKTVYTTWKMCYDMLRPESESAARPMMWLISFLHHDAIQEHIFERALAGMQLYRAWLPQTKLELEAGEFVRQFLLRFSGSEGRWDHLKYIETMAELTSISLIEFDQINKVHTLHVLLQEWARTALPSLPQVGLERTITLLAFSIDNDTTANGYMFKRLLMPHVNSVTSSNEGLTITNLNSAERLSQVYMVQGKWEAAEIMQAQVRQAAEKHLGGEHKYTMASISSLASLHRKQGRWAEAEKLESQVLDKRKRVLGEKHPDTLLSMNSLAMTYRYQGRWSKAELLGTQVLEVQKRVLGEEHPDTLQSMNNLALTYNSQGQWGKGEVLEKQVIGIQTRVLDEEHPDTLLSMRGLVDTYLNQGRWHEGETLAVKVIDTQKRVLGKEHPDLLGSMTLLALAYCGQGKWNDAEALATKTIDIQKQVLGEEHPDLLTSKRVLASVYCGQGKWKKAEGLAGEVLGTCRQVLGQEHPETLQCLGELASVYCGQGRWNEAKALDEQVLDLRKRIFGEEHPSTLWSMSRRASIYWHQGRWSDAEALEIQALDMKMRILGEEHPSTLNDMCNLVATYGKQGQWNKAEVLAVQVIELQKRVLGDEHPETLGSINNLALIHRSQGRWQNAEATMLQVLATQERVLGKEHPDTIHTMSNLANIHGKQNQWGRAEELMALALEIQRQTLGEDHPDTIRSMTGLEIIRRKLKEANVQLQLIKSQDQALRDAPNHRL
ncbi:Nephrocystin-3 [Xenopus laevis] [Rhizoctonia solani]|uniref:Nephrocystin-3 [Xenopus laevis] n=1 Tax=Rhizoctonia solani TaxID=456999 RepID=A0A0K6GIY5_9AGAM|nr:Nephrocystin-3 [Xenopus laevis] [Rhizoctonia solani]